MIDKDKCVICKQRIDQKKERWVILNDMNKGEKVSEIWYHLKCWRERFVITNSARKQHMYKGAMKSVGKIVQALRGKDDSGGQVMEIR